MAIVKGVAVIAAANASCVSGQIPLLVAVRGKIIITGAQVQCMHLLEFPTAC